MLVDTARKQKSEKKDKKSRQIIDEEASEGRTRSNNQE